MALQQRQNCKNQSTYCLISEAQVCTNAYLSSMQQIQAQISQCLQNSQEISNQMGIFCQQYKNHEDQIQRLQEKIRQKRKKHAFKKNHQIPLFEEVFTNKRSYLFTPTIIQN